VSWREESGVEKKTGHEAEKSADLKGGGLESSSEEDEAKRGAERIEERDLGKGKMVLVSRKGARDPAGKR